MKRAREGINFFTVSALWSELVFSEVAMFLLIGPRLVAADWPRQVGTLGVGLSIALVMLVSGLLYARIGGAAFLVMAALCLLAMPACAALQSSGKEDA